MRMSRTIKRAVIAVIVIATAGSVARGSSERDGTLWREDDEIFEITGQARVLSPTSAIQYGYLSSISGLDGIFSTDVPSAQNETNAFFTFSNTATTLRATTQGGLVVVTREGTMTVYLDSAPNGNFADPTTFADGTPVQVSTWRHQVILDSATNRFTVQFTNTITSVTPFDWRGESIRLGRVGKRFRIIGSGLLRSPGLFDLAGYALMAGNETLPLAAEPGQARLE
jgi:hypothetical protein